MYVLRQTVEQKGDNGRWQFAWSNTLGGGVWFTSAWGPIMAGDLPQTILKAMLPGGTISFTK